MDNKNNGSNPLPVQQTPTASPLLQVPEANTPASNPAPKKSPRRLKILGIIMLAALGIASLVFAIWMLLIASFFTAACNPSHTRQEVQAEEQRQTAAMDKLVILSGQRTHATADGNNDCIDGVPSSVSATASFQVNTPYNQLRDEVTANLAQRGYQPSGQVQISDIGNSFTDDSGRSTFTGVKQVYKNSRGNALGITYSFPVRYPYICPNAAKICSDPDLQEIEAASVENVTVDNSPID